MSKIKYNAITVEALKGYEKSNPVKFKLKFGDLDLDNIPEQFILPDGEFDSVSYRRAIIAMSKKPELIPAFVKQEVVIEKPIVEQKSIEDKKVIEEDSKDVKVNEEKTDNDLGTVKTENPVVKNKNLKAKTK